MHFRYPGRRKKEKVSEKIYEEIIVENFLNLGKEKDVYAHEAQRVLNRINPKRHIPRHIIIKNGKC